MTLGAGAGLVGNPPVRRFGLRVRAAVVFALLSLVVVSVLALVTYFVAQRYLVQQRERSANRQAFLNARLVRDALVDRSTPPADALALLELSPRSQAAFVRDGEWFGASVVIGPETLPNSFRDEVDTGNAVHMRVDLVGEDRYLVGIPIPAVDGAYFEAFSLKELSDTLAVIRNALLVGVLATPVAAGVLGLWASRLVLRPVGDVSTAAAQIAAGDLAARLDASADPDLRRVAESFNTMVDALTERMERDERFAADVSHELRSPLTTLSTAAAVLGARRDELTPRVRQAADLVSAEVERFRELVEGLLELNRIQAGADAVELEPARLGELLLHVVTRSRAGSVVVQIAPDLDRAPVMLEKRRVERIVVNLLDNAREHGGGELRLSATRDDHRVRIVVEDEGPGIRPEDRERIFERFARGRRAGSRGDSLGSGLGLALVAEHVRLLGGRVWVEDREPGPGARFVVELPGIAP